MSHHATEGRQSCSLPMSHDRGQSPFRHVVSHPTEGGLGRLFLRDRERQNPDRKNTVVPISRARRKICSLLDCQLKERGPVPGAVGKTSLRRAKALRSWAKWIRGASSSCLLGPRSPVSGTPLVLPLPRCRRARVLRPSPSAGCSSPSLCPRAMCRGGGVSDRM